MAMSESKKRACRKYQQKLKGFTIRVKPAEMEQYQSAAKKANLSFRAFVLAALEHYIHLSQ